MVQERRRSQRVNCDAGGCSVLLRLELQDPLEAVVNTMAGNVSLGGLSFEVGKDVALPDPLPLKVFLPHAHTPLDCSSRIAWQKANEHTIRAGVSFKKLQDDYQRTLEDFLREVGAHAATVECAPAPLETQVLTGPVEAEEAQPPPPKQELEPPPLHRGSRREQAIWQFEQGVLLYHQRKLGLAKREFQKVIKEYADVIDVARVARRYHDWCEEEKGGIAHG